MRYRTHFIVVRIRMSCKLECSQHAGNFKCSPVRNSCSKQSTESMEGYEYYDDSNRKYLIWIPVVLVASFVLFIIYRKMRKTS